MSRIFSIVTLFLGLLATVATAQAQPRGDWEVLGEQRSRPGVESLVIDVPGRRAGRFDALKVGYDEAQLAAARPGRFRERPKAGF